MKKLFLFHILVLTIFATCGWMFVPSTTAAFTPGSLTNLQVWLEADRGITKDGSNNVSHWVDQSSNAYDFAPTTTQPVWNSSDAGINSNPTVTFSGAAHVKNAVALLNGTTSSSFTLYAVVKTGTLSAAPILAFLSDSSGRGYQLAFWDNPTYRYFEMNASTVYPGVRCSDVKSSTTWYSPSFTYTGTGTGTGALANYQMYFSNSAGTTLAAGSATDTSSNTYIGNYKSGTSQFSGPIALFVFQSSVATSQERTNMATYINTKYGL